MTDFSGWTSLNSVPNVEQIAQLRDSSNLNIELNTAKGWRGDSIDFLLALPNLAGLKLIGGATKNYELIGELESLQYLLLDSAPANSAFIDLTRLSMLRSLYVVGDRYVFDGPSHDLWEVGIAEGKFEYVGQFVCRSTQKLVLKSTRVSTLNFLGTCPYLWSLVLGGLRGLPSIKPLELLSNLTVLDVIKCSDFGDLAFLRSLRKLNRLSLVDLGNVESILAIEELKNLEELYFYGTTNVVDGHVDFLRGLVSLKRVSFQNRKHYDCKLSRIKAALNL